MCKGLHRQGAGMTLEYAWQDWCLAQFARALGHQDDADWLLRRSAQAYLWLSGITAMLAAPLAWVVFTDPRPAVYLTAMFLAGLLALFLAAVGASSVRDQAWAAVVAGAMAMFLVMVPVVFVAGHEVNHWGGCVGCGGGGD